MKYPLFIALMLILTIGIKNAKAENQKDSSLIKKVLVLENKLAAQQKEIDLLKTKNTKETKYTINRKGSKQWMKKE